MPMSKKPLTWLLMLCACGAALAQSASVTGTNPTAPQHQGADFGAMKQKVLQHLQARMQMLQTAQNCVNAAIDHKALAQCREQEQQAMENLKRRTP